MAIEKIIQIDVDEVRALGGLDNLKKSFKEVDNSTKSLKQQMIEAQREVTTLSEKFGATSKEAIEAAKRASELKDKIGDAKSLTDAFNPDAKFKSLSASLGGVASGFAAYQGAMGLAGVESKDLEQQLLKVQSAMAIAQGLQGLGEARDSFKQLKAVALDAFKGIKTAIGSTGIGLLVVALGTIYAYWDDIKEAVSGVSEEQKKLNVDSQKNVEQENEKLKTLGSQDNILKLQGKSEKEILAIKVKQTDEAIQATEINQKNQIQTNKLAVEGAKRNYDMLRSYIDFVSTPLRFLYQTGAEAINGIIDLLNKIPGVNIKAKLDETLGDKAADYITKLGFDPDKVKADGEKSVKEANDALIKLKNDRAGYQLAINDIGKKETEDAKKKAEELAKLEDERRQKLLDELDAMNDFDQRVIDNEAKKNAELKKLDDEAFAQLEKDFDDKQKLDQKAKDEELQREKILADGKRAIRESELQAIEGGIGLLKSLAGKSKALQATALIAESAVGIAKIIMNTQTANAAVTAKYALIPGGVALATAEKTLNRVNAGIGIATNLVALKSGLSALGGGGGGSAPSGGGGGSESTPPSFNIVGQNPNNQLAQSIAQQQQQPLQAYVVSGNVTSAQSLDRNKIDTATFN